MKNARHSIDYLRILVRYEPESGRFFWILPTSRAVKVGDEAARATDARGYRYFDVARQKIYAQRLAWMLMTGEQPEFKITFRDNDPSNCRWVNLAMNRGIKGHDFQTKEGRAAYQLEYRGSRRRQFNDDHRQRTYGITPADYNAKIAAQDNKCAICQKEETETRKDVLRALSVDHNHKTGQVRDLLCQSCNKLIGLANEDRDVLVSALRYLDKHSADAPVVVPLKGAER